MTSSAGRQLTSAARAARLPLFLRDPKQRERELLASVVAVLADHGEVDTSRSTRNARIQGPPPHKRSTDGYMRFRMNADVEGIELTRTAAERLVYTETRAWDDYYDTLMAVIDPGMPADSVRPARTTVPRSRPQLETWDLPTSL